MTALLYAQEKAALAATELRKAQFAEAQSGGFAKLFAKFPQLQENVDLKPLANFKVGGAAKLFYEIASEAELAELRAYLSEHYPTLPLIFLGKACNMLISDAGVSALVLYMGDKFQQTALAEDWHSWDPSYVEEAQRKLSLTLADIPQVLKNYALVHVQAGKELKVLVNELAKQAYSGLEFACGIPGSVGGATYMNAGAYGGQIADSLLGVRYMDAQGRICELRPSQLHYDYRQSYFMQPNMQNALILAVSFLVKRVTQTEVLAEITQLNAKRSSSQPLEYPSAGSIFKRPAGYFAGKLISDANLKGYRVGGAAVSEKHAGFIINQTFNCQARDISRLIHHIQSEIFRLHELELQTEVRYIGDFAIADFVTEA